MGSKDYVKRILEAMSAVLEPAGFRKKGLVFIAEREDVFHVASIFRWPAVSASICALTDGATSIQ